jgi:hypothetical protein
MTFVPIILNGRSNPFSPDYVVDAFKPLSPEGRPYPAIRAVGDITAGSADALKAFLQEHTFPDGTIIVLDSLGGDLEGGLRLGSFIRERKLNTIVGLAINLPSPQDPGEGDCMSACTFAFLGGIDRFIAAIPSGKTRFGLHRFYAAAPTINSQDALQIGQIRTAQILQYVTAMGADPSLIQEMIKAGPGQMNLMSEDQLVAFHLVTRVDVCRDQSGTLVCRLKDVAK